MLKLKTSISGTEPNLIHYCIEILFARDCFTDNLISSAVANQPDEIS